MKAIDFKRFVFENNIKQSELVEYLNVSKGYISLVVSGKKKLSEENLRKLLNNPFGWDTTLLSQPAEIISRKDSIAEGALITELRAQIERLEGKIEKLETKIDNLNQELGEKNALLKMARQGGEESARDAGVSLSASAI